MKINKQLTDEMVINELGERLAKLRLERNLTQAGFAHLAGISKRTVERLEAGGSVQLSNLVRMCRALDLTDRLDVLVPEPAPSPVAQLKLRGDARKRATSSKTTGSATKKWSWGNES
ncbi:MAG: helix-turn-helix domain-containing protein [Planctomycetota bacterium]